MRRCSKPGNNLLANTLQMETTGLGRRSEGKRSVKIVAVSWNPLAAFVLAITAYFHYVRLLGFLAILAAILAAFFRRTIAGGMRTRGL